VDEEAVLGEEAGEQQSVPLLVGAFGDEELEVLSPIAKLASLSSQPTTKSTIVIVEVSRGSLRCDGQCGESGSNRLFGGASAFGAGVFESLPLLGCEYRHSSYPQLR
jgi:hypothetical protein